MTAAMIAAMPSGCLGRSDPVTAALVATDGVTDVASLLSIGGQTAERELKSYGYDRLVMSKPAARRDETIPLSAVPELSDAIPQAGGTVARLLFTRAIGRGEASFTYGVVVDIGASDRVLQAKGLLLFSVVS